VSRYHLHARALEGPLRAPRRDEVRVTQTDDADEAETWAHDQADDGFSVWVYDHGHQVRVAGASDYRLIAHYRPASGATPASDPARIPRMPRAARRPSRDPTPTPPPGAVEQLRSAHRR
jgi:hypothetical protein